MDFSVNDIPTPWRELIIPHTPIFLLREQAALISNGTRSDEVTIQEAKYPHGDLALKISERLNRLLDEGIYNELMEGDINKEDVNKDDIIII